MLETRFHDWNADPYSQGTWCVARPGQFAKALDALQSPHGRVFFGSGDWANAWRGFIDGAIEQGIIASRDVVKLLTSRSPPS